MAFHNSLWGTMKVALFHGSLNKLMFKLNRKWVFNIQILILKYFQFKGFLKRWHIECLCFVSIVLWRWYYFVKYNFPKCFYLWFKTYDFFCVNFMNVKKIECMFVEYNGVSLISGNCKKCPMNIMLILPNGKMSYFSFCSFKCIITSNVQPTMDILSMMMNWIFGHMLN
jgi:hypothetical protein